MTIYIRTAAGNEAALNPHSPLPRKLRTLLIGIDGRTGVDTYVNSLSSFGDVDALLGSLHDAGLIEAAAAARPVAGRSADDEHTPVSQSASWSDTDADRSAFRETAAAPAGAFARLGNAFRRADTAASVPGTDELSSWARFQSPSAPASPPAPSAGRQQPAQAGYYAPSGAGSASSTAQYQLRNAISLMSDFVSQHLPVDSLEIVLALEGLGSVEQVLASLKGYEALVAPVGEPARKHLAELRAVLARF
jgi:hypothetical protein